MTYSVDVVVIEVKADFDPWGGEYTHVSFGSRLPLPTIIPPGVSVVGPMPKQVVYKHALHIIIPRDKWFGQYNMWEPYHLIVKDEGQIELKKAEAKV